MKQEGSEALPAVEREENWLIIHSRKQKVSQGIWEKVWERGSLYKTRSTDEQGDSKGQGKSSANKHFRATSNGYCRRKAF